ncbi:MAG: TonB-dependent receptor [Pedobacter sp.]|nr:MAG: TonB-dependent receptor [Pedobacter sp.]
MCKIFTRLVCFLGLVLLTNQMTFAQNITISGTVTDKESGEPLAGVAITVKGKARGTLSNEHGDFKLIITENVPLVLSVTYVGYQTIEQTVTGSTNDLKIQLEAQAVLGQEVVVAASRTPERILESPVSIERVGAAAVRESATPSFYDALVNLKGVESSTQSLTFRSLNTRGFNANGNVRFNQFIDGMDNQAPGLNFSVGNIVGISDLDVESAELIPGASSALYGAGGTNGTLIMTSKSPFKNPGLSFSYKVGMNHVDNLQRSASSFEDMSLRFAKVWNNKFAFKTNISYIDASDWQAQNYNDFNRLTSSYKVGTRATDPNYDGVNVYGDEINYMYTGIPGGSPLNGQTVSRTGYNEVDLVDYAAKGFKTSNSLHYKFGRGLELIGQANWGTGTSVYTGTARYSLRNFKIGQYKLELKGDNFFVRAYTTQENSGDTYQATALASLINEAWKSSSTWFLTYAGAYNAARVAGKNDADAHTAARSAADVGRWLPGGSPFETAKQQIVSRPIGDPKGGAKFNDKSSLYHGEGMYNFTNMLNNAVELIAGASYRFYDLNSEGTLFNDLNGNITIGEYGGYVQVAKKVLQEKLKLAASGRYDKSQNFDGRVTPRVSAVYTIAHNNNIRVSYQTGFRNPTTQNQYIDLAVGGGLQIIGGLPNLLDKYNLRTQPAYTVASVAQFKASAAAGAPNPALLQTYTFGDFKPESVQAYEVGYKGLLTNKLMVDVAYYYNSFKDYILQWDVIQANPTTADPSGLIATPRRFSTVVNSPDQVNMQGVAVGIDYKVGKFTLSTNGTYNDLVNTNTTLVTDFNTPKYRFNVGVSSREVAKNVGFNVVYRWQDQYNWSSTFIAGNVPAFGTVDAQVSYRLPAYSTTLKLGGSNILNQYYATSYGNPQVGGMYYVSIVFDQLMK